MPKPECFELCPHVTECIEPLVQETQVPSSSNIELVRRQIDDLKRAVATVAATVCVEGPVIEERTIEKGGYFGSKKRVERRVYTCGVDGYAQPAAYYYCDELMPPQ